MYYYGPMMNGSDWGLGIFVMFAWILLLGLIAYLALRLIRGHDHGSASKAYDPLDIIKERYAKGEINKEHFEQLKKDLSK